MTFREIMNFVSDKYPHRLDDYIEDKSEEYDLQASTDSMIYELYERGVDMDRVFPGYNIHKVWDRDELREHLLDVLGMGHYHTDEEIVQRIREELSRNKKSRSGGSLSSVQQESKQIVLT